jgi:hypothetical protein
MSSQVQIIASWTLLRWLYLVTARSLTVTGIATCYGLDGPGIESRWGRYGHRAFLHTPERAALLWDQPRQWAQEIFTYSRSCSSVVRPTQSMGTGDFYILQSVQLCCVTNPDNGPRGCFPEVKRLVCEAWNSPKIRTFEALLPLFHRPSRNAWYKFNITSPWFILQSLRQYSIYCHSIRVSAM